MIPAGEAPDVRQVANSLDAEFVNGYAPIGSSRSGLTQEAVKQLEGICQLPEDKLRVKLTNFATLREAIPAASYADHLVRGIADEPDPFGRIYSYALRNAWQDEALHTQFLLQCVPRSSGAKWRRRAARLGGYAAGTWSGHVYHDPGWVTRLLHKAIVPLAGLLRNAPANAIDAIKPMPTKEYFDTSVDFEYAAALGWRVISKAELPQREFPHGSGELNRIEWRGQENEPGDLARVSEQIASTEIRHAMVFWQMAWTSTENTLVSELVAIHNAFVAPEFRGHRLARDTYRVEVHPAGNHDRLIQELVAKACEKNGTGGTPAQVALVIGECSQATERMVNACLRESDQWQHRTISAPEGLHLQDDDRPSREMFIFEAGCARAFWPKAWVDADVRISIAGVGNGRRSALSLGALSHLVEVFPEELRRSLRGTPDPELYALMWLVERHPPDLSIIFSDDGKMLYDSDAEVVAFDEAVVRWHGLSRSSGLQEALRWFGPLIPEVLLGP